jgi:transcriptional regulator of acetoin/glycerol metabolism
MVLDALVRHGGRISEVSQELGVSRHAFLELAVKLGIAVH